MFAEFCSEIGVSFEGIAFLNGSFIVSDVVDPIQPIVFASAEFQLLTGYSAMQQRGRKCSFIQGKDTNPNDVNNIRALVSSRSEGFVKVLNYRLNGSPFLNILYLAPLVPTSGNSGAYMRYMIGCQCNASEVLSRILVVPGPPLFSMDSTKLRIRHVETGVVFRPNGCPVAVNGENFEGMVYVKTKTTPGDPRVAACFQGKRTKFEVQVQGRFKGSIVGSKLLVNVCVKEPVTVTMSPAASAFIEACNRIVTPPRARMSLTSSRPWFSCPLMDVVDIMVGVGPDDSPPAVGAESFPMRSTEHQYSAPFDTSRTYSFSFQSCFLDLEKWEMCNLPGIKSIGLRAVIGDQPINVVLTVAGANTTVMEFEIAHASLPDQLW